MIAWMGCTTVTGNPKFTPWNHSKGEVTRIVLDNQLPLLFYSDAVSSVVVGVLFLVYRGQVTSRGASAADVNPAAG